MEYYSAIKNKRTNETLPPAITWTDIRGYLLSEIGQTEEDKYHMISPIFGIQKPKQTNKTGNKVIDIENILTAARL